MRERNRGRSVALKARWYGSPRRGSSDHLFSTRDAAPPTTLFISRRPGWRSSESTNRHEPSPGPAEALPDREVEVTFITGSILELGTTGTSRHFATILGSGLFHTFDRRGQQTLAAAYHRLVRPGGACILLEISDQESGPTPGIAPADIRRAFTQGWNIAKIQQARYETSFPFHIDQGGALAWLAIVSRP